MQAERVSNADANPNGNADSNTNSDSHTDPDSYGYADADRYSYSNANSLAGFYGDTGLWQRFNCYNSRSGQLLN